jgi:hypothetical protein
MRPPSPLSNVQIELLKYFPYTTSEEELVALRRVLAQFFAQRAMNEMDRLWTENNWTNDTMDIWLQEENEP